MKTRLTIFALLIAGLPVQAQLRIESNVEEFETRFEESKGQDLKALRSLLFNLEGRKQFEEAREWIKRRQELAPDKPSGWLLEARNLHLQGKSPEALLVLQDAARRFDRQLLDEAEANFRGRSGQKEEAWAMFWAIFDEADSREEWLDGLSALRQVERDSREILKQLEKRKPTARNELAMARIKWRSHPDPHLERALEIEPENPEVWLEHALFFEQDGQLEEARKAWERAAELGGGLEAEAGLTRFLLAAGDVDGGLSRVRQLLDAGRITPAIAPGLINELLDLGEWKIAIEILEDTIPKSANPWTGEAVLAVLHSELGNQPEAIKLAENAKASLPIRDRSDRFFGYLWFDPVRGGYWHQPGDFGHQPRGRIYSFPHKLLWQPTAPIGEILEPEAERLRFESLEDPWPIVYAVDADRSSVFAFDEHEIRIVPPVENNEAEKTISLVRSLASNFLTAESMSVAVKPLESISPEIAEAVREHFSPEENADFREIARFGVICELIGQPDEARIAYRNVLSEFPEDDVVRIRLVHAIDPRNAEVRGKLLSQLDLAASERFLRDHVQENVSDDWLRALTVCLSQELPANPPDYLFRWVWSRNLEEKNVTRETFRALNEAMLRHPNLAHLALLFLMSDPDAEPKPEWWSLALSAAHDGYPEVSLPELQAQLSNRLGQPDSLQKLAAGWESPQQLLPLFYHGEKAEVEAEFARQLTLNPKRWDEADLQARTCLLALRAAEFRGLEIDFSALFLNWNQNRVSIQRMEQTIAFWLQKLESEGRIDDAVDLLAGLWRRRLGDIENWENAEEVDQRVFTLAVGLKTKEAKRKIAQLPSRAPFFENLRRNFGIELSETAN